ncbi:MAG: hypothetical protein EOL88_03510 [Bacteroidia bacterium]|nr:hypothetical protein [Bacteroidia bacterium]
MEEYSLLQHKLYRFIRKYYLNRVIRGLLYAFIIASLTLLLLLALENRLWLGTSVRTLIFWGALILFFATLLSFVFIPLFKLFRLGGGLTEKQAAILIGEHFTEVDDVLLNTLELKELLDSCPSKHALLEASVAQKTAALRPVPFHRAVNLKSNLKYLKFVVPALLVFVLLWLLNPSFLTDSGDRLIHYNQEYEKPRPFQFHILNAELVAVQNEDFSLQVRITGDFVPDAVYVQIGNQKYRLTTMTNHEFLYQFRNLTHDQRFHLVAGDYATSEYTIRVYPKPVLLDFQVNITFPEYLGRPAEMIANLSDISLPEGSQTKWSFFTRDCDRLHLIFPDTVLSFTGSQSNVFTFQQTIKKTTSFRLVTANAFLNSRDTLDYSVKSIPDAYPELQVEVYHDSAQLQRLFFNGTVRDDYGFTGLRFFYTHATNGIPWSENIRIAPNVTRQTFFHAFDLQPLSLTPGDEVHYYFEVCDNDGISGSKCVRSVTAVFQVPTLQEIEALAQQDEDNLLDEMDQALNETQEIKKEIEALTRKMLENPEVGWEEMDKLNALVERQQEMNARMEELFQKNNEMNTRESEFKNFDPALLEKQQKLEELFQELMSEEMREMFEEMQQLMEEMDKNKMSELLQEMDLSNEELEARLDRTLELFRKLEVEKDLTDYARQLEELATRQEENAEATKNAEQSASDSLLKAQQKLKDEFDRLSEKFDQIMEKNQELEQPFPIDDPAADESEVQQLQQESMEQMQNGKNNQSAQSQNSAAGKMKQMAEAMMKGMEGMQMQQIAEDREALRQLLENLIQLSFMQEELIETLQVMRRNDPEYNALIRRQNTIRTDMEMVKDSLEALGKRQMAIKPFITEKIVVLNHHLEAAVEFLTEYRTSNTLKEQQYSMTAINDLALLLLEAMDQMEKQMQQMMSGGSGQSTCPSPGGEGEMDISTMRQLQEQLSKQLEEMKSGMKPGGEMPGGMSEKLARAAAQQMAIRRELQQMAEEMMEQSGQMSGNMRQMLQQMEQNETDIVNKRITQATLNRQKDIVTRLLESERAEMQRDKDEQRKSNEVKLQKYSNPDAILEYNKKKEKEAEMLRTIPPALNPFFRVKVNDYFYRVKEE